MRRAKCCKDPMQSHGVESQPDWRAGQTKQGQPRIRRGSRGGGELGGRAGGLRREEASATVARQAARDRQTTATGAPPRRFRPAPGGSDWLRVNALSVCAPFLGPVDGLTPRRCRPAPGGFGRTGKRTETARDGQTAGTHPEDVDRLLVAVPPRVRPPPAVPPPLQQHLPAANRRIAARVCV